MYLFGAPRLKQADLVLHLSRRKIFALLAYMAFSKHQIHRASLAVLLWPEHDSTHSQGSLRVLLSELQKTIGPDILPVKNELVGPLDLKRISIDIEEFQAIMAQIRLNRRSGTKQSLLKKAVKLYQGNFMSGFTLKGCGQFSDWQFQQGEYLHRELCFALQQLVSIYEQEGEYEEGIAYSQRHVEVDSLNEEAHCSLMRLYAANGQREAALHQFQVCEKNLQEELELEPDESTRELYESIRHSRPEKPRLAMQNNLPAQNTVFLGRERDQGEIARLIIEQKQHILTLTGPGGTGKTRLALQIASNLLDRFEQGAWFVDLSQVQDKNGIFIAMIEALKIPIPKGKENDQQIIDFLKKRTLLLILDTFEQILPHSDIVGRISSECPGITIIITSREILHIYGEYEYIVEPLEYPDEIETKNLDALCKYEALTFFIQRARAVKGDFSMDEQNAPAIAGICSQLDGLPLAIELAASRSKIFKPQQLLKKLDNKLGFLTGGARNRSERQQTIRGTIEWSYKLLTAEEQILFNRLSIFQSGCSIDSVDGICVKELSFDGLKGLESLMNKSLIMQREDAMEEPRFFMLDTIREFAFELLNISPTYSELESRFLDYYSKTIEQAETLLLDINKRSATVGAIRIEFDNIRKTIQWYFDHGEYDRAIFLHGCLLWFYDTGFRLDVFFHFTELSMEHVHKTTGKTKGLGLECSGIYYHRRVDHIKAYRFLMDALSCYEETGLDVYAGRAGMVAAAHNMRITNNKSECLNTILEASELFKNHKQKVLEIDSYNMMGVIEHFGKNHKQAEKYYKEGLEQIPKGLLPHRLYVFSYNLALLYMDAHEFNYVQAKPYLESLIHDTQRRGTTMEKISILGLVSRYFYHCEKYELSSQLFGAMIHADEFYGGIIYTREDYDMALEGLEQYFGKDKHENLLKTGETHSLDESLDRAEKNLEL